MRHYCRVPSLFVEKEYLGYERCTICDVVFRNPRVPDQQRLERYVEKPLRPEHTELDPVSQAHCRHMARQLRQLMPPGSPCRLLDFGCGAGGFLLEARTVGFEVKGLEVNSALAKLVAERYGIPVFSGVVTDPAFDDTFDVIVSRQVFEHLTDPKGALAALTRHLTPGGLLLIEVPNLHHIRERLRKGSTMDDSHLFYFNRASLSHLVQAGGFEVLRVREGLRPHRFVADGRNLPSAVVEAYERVFSILQVKTGLSLVARLH